MNNQKPITIQINSVEALERLIGGNTQAEIDIRNSVVQTFATRHLKAVANTDHIAQLAKNLSTAVKTSADDLIQAQVGEVKRNWSGFIESVKLNSKVQAEIDGQVKQQAANLVDAAIAVCTAELRDGLEKRISGAVKMRLDYEIGQEVKKQVSDAFRRALESKS
ncbi:MAG: hypothetical protein HOO67_03305 [Candidatus Peribacteraceae bacterium]|nr:hypothetical protein [Candidatus Peribacteraceae bacterium]